MVLFPETRFEAFLAKIAGESGPDLEPITRTEAFLDDIAGAGHDLEPRTRFEYWLQKIAENAGGAGPALYPLANGTHSDGGVTVTITNGKHVHITAENAMSTPYWINLLTGECSNTAGIVNNKPAAFVLTAGKSATVTLKNIVNDSGLVFGANIRVAYNTVSGPFGFANSAYVGDESRTSSDGVVAGCLFMYLALEQSPTRSGVLDFDVEITMEGAKLV